MSEWGVWADCAFGVEPKPVGALPKPGAVVGFDGCPDPPVAAAGWMNGEVLDDFTPKPVPVSKPVVAACDGWPNPVDTG